MATLLSGYTTLASGSKAEKGDVIARHYACECKDTMGQCIRFKYSDWEKIAYDAAQAFKEPLMHLRMSGASYFVMTMNQATEIWTWAESLVPMSAIWIDCGGNESVLISDDWRAYETISITNFGPPKAPVFSLFKEVIFAPIFTQALEKMPRRFGV